MEFYIIFKFRYFSDSNYDLQLAFCSYKSFNGSYLLGMCTVLIIPAINSEYLGFLFSFQRRQLNLFSFLSYTRKRKSFSTS